MAQTFFNQNQILGVQLIPSNAIRWKVGNTFLPLEKVFHAKATWKKRVFIAYTTLDSGVDTFHSLCDDRVIPDTTNYDALMETDNYQFEGESMETPIPLIMDSENISFKSTEQKSSAGVLYTNKLEYSLPKVTDTGTGKTQMEKLEQQLALLQSGDAFHLLFQLASCEKARSIILCPEDGAFSATVDDTIANTKVTITVKNLTAHQFLK